MAMRKRYKVGSKMTRLSHAREAEKSVKQTSPLRKRGEDSMPSSVIVQNLQSVAAAVSRLWRDLAIAPSSFPRDHDEHSHRVAVFSLRIARLLGRGKEEEERILRAAYLHDIGGAGVPMTFTRKPGQLTPQERAAMQVHPLISCQLLDAFLSTKDLAKIALSHHERFDGSGYPNGLQGAKIPLEARVITVADSLDAMISPRPYRNALPFSVALEELKLGAGRQFDPNIVEAIVRQGETLALCPSAPSAFE